MKPTLERLRPTGSWSGPVIDCDVHANVPSLDALLPYQPHAWQEATRERGWKGPTVNVAYPPGAETTCHPDWRPETGLPASDVGMLRRDLLDQSPVERAIVNCYYAVDSLRHPDWARALAASVNDWLADQWLSREPRLRGSIVIPGRDPDGAAAEIDRVMARHPGFVQVLLPVRSDGLYGQRKYWPLFDAVVRHGLVAGIHWGGQAEGAASPTGYASWFAEESSAETQVFASQLTSLVIEGTFQKFPDLRVSMLEGGFNWVPTWSWNLNKKWKGLRREIPWVDRAPTEIIRDHLRFSTAPADLGPEEHVRTVIEWFCSADMLMYASDYPHDHGEDVDRLLAAAPEPMRANVMSETARRWYRL